MKNIKLSTYILTSILLLSCDSGLSKNTYINESSVENKSKPSKIYKLEGISENNSRHKEFTNSSSNDITSLPLSYTEYFECYYKNDKEFCSSRYPVLAVSKLPENLKIQYQDIEYIDTAFRLPDLNGIQVYILGRTSTDVEEYSLLSFNHNIIDSIQIAKIGAGDTLDYSFYISNDYSLIKVTGDELDNTYSLTKNGEIKLVN